MIHTPIMGLIKVFTINYHRMFLQSNSYGALVLKREGETRAFLFFRVKAPRRENAWIE